MNADVARDSAARVGRSGSSFVYIERGAPRLVEAALAAAGAAELVSKSTLHFEGECLTVGVRSALRQLSSHEGWTGGVVAVDHGEPSPQRDARRASLARVMLARSADARAGLLTFVASQDSSDELRQQLFALTQVLTEEFPRANVQVRFVPRSD